MFPKWCSRDNFCFWEILRGEVEIPKFCQVFDDCIHPMKQVCQVLYAWDFAQSAHSFDVGVFEIAYPKNPGVYHHPLIKVDTNDTLHQT